MLTNSDKNFIAIWSFVVIFVVWAVGFKLHLEIQDVNDKPNANIEAAQCVDRGGVGE